MGSSRFDASWTCPRSSASVIERWRERDTMARYLARNADVRAALQLHRRADHREQPDGRAPRLGPHLQGPLPALPHDARRAAALPERLRLPGPVDRGRGREGAGLQQQAGDRGVRHRPLRRALQGARRRSSPPSRPSSRSASATGWTGTTATTRTPTRTTTRSGPSSRSATARSDLQGPRRDAVVPALRHRASRNMEIATEGYRGGQAPVGDVAAPDHEPTATTARTCWSGRRRHGRCRATWRPPCTRS